MKATGIVRRIDDLGRVVIPKGHCTQGDPAQVRSFLEERLAACHAALEEPEEDE